MESITLPFCSNEKQKKMPEDICLSLSDIAYNDLIWEGESRKDFYNYCDSCIREWLHQATFNGSWTEISHIDVGSATPSLSQKAYFESSDSQLYTAIILNDYFLYGQVQSAIALLRFDPDNNSGKLFRPEISLFVQWTYNFELINSIDFVQNLTGGLIT